MLYTNNLKKELREAVKQLEAKEMETTYRMTISKEVEDRDGETVLLSGMDLKNYKKNPVVLLDHSYKVENIVGKTTKLSIEDNALVADFVFIDTENGKLAQKLYEAGLLKASSIGFMAKQRDQNDFSKIIKSELLEWSLVAVPANAEALSLDAKVMEEAISKGFIQKQEINEMQEIKNELAEIKSILLALKTDDKEVKEIDNKKEKVLKQKETLQQIDRAVGEALKNLKFLQTN